MSVDDRLGPEANIESCEHQPAVEFDDARSVFPFLNAAAIIEEMRTGRYTRLGHAFGIENSAGELYGYRQRKDAQKGIPHKQWSIPSETVMGIFDDDHQLIRPETIEETLTRCLAEEQEIDLTTAPPDAEFTVVRNSAILVLDWQRWDTTKLPERTKGVYSVSASILANDVMAEFLEEAGQPTQEAAEAGAFKGLDFLRARIRANRTRAGFAFWLEQHNAAAADGFHDPQVMPIRKRDESLQWEDIRMDWTTQQFGATTLRVSPNE